MMVKKNILLPEHKINVVRYLPWDPEANSLMLVKLHPFKSGWLPWAFSLIETLKIIQSFQTY